MEEQDRYHITDNFFLSGNSESWVIYIGENVLDILEYSYIILSYSQFKDATQFHDLLNDVDLLIGKRAYKTVDSWIPSYFIGKIYLMLKAWYEENYSTSEDVYKQLILRLLSRFGDSQAKLAIEKVIIKSLAEGYYTLLLKREKNSYVIHDTDELHDVYTNLRPFHKIVTCIGYDKLDINVSIDTLMKDMGCEDPTLVEETSAKLLELSKAYDPDYFYKRKWPSRYPPLLLYCQNLLRTFLRKFEYTLDSHKQVISIFMQLPKEFVDNVLLKIVRNRYELKYVFMEDYTQIIRIHQDLINSLVDILRMEKDKERKRNLTESLISFILENPSFLNLLGRSVVAFSEVKLRKLIDEPPERIFRWINDYMEVILNEDGAEVYVGGVAFQECRYKFPTVGQPNTTSYSMDRFLDNQWEEDGDDYRKYNIDGWTEFQIHCSYLQEWVDNNYDTRLLYRDIAFPFLEVLIVKGDTVAKKVFKKEIIKRTLAGYEPVMEYLHKGGYLRNLDSNDINYLISEAKFNNQRMVIEFLKTRGYVGKKII